MKICYLTELLTPYRVEWMNLLGESAIVEAYYIKESETTRNDEWLGCVKRNFEAKLISGISNTGFAKYLVSKDYDIYIIDGYSSRIKVLSIFVLLFHGKLVYINIDGIDLRKKKRAIFEIPKDLCKRVIFRSKAHFLCGSYAASKLIIQCGANERNVHNHHFTSLFERDLFNIPATLTEKEKYRKELCIPEEKIIISVGRFSYLGGYGKGYDVLLRAAKNMEDEYGWYIIGGEPTEEFKRLTKEAGVKNFHYVKHINKEELKKYYRAADIFVLMTVSDVWGLVINEAMACGLPVITTDKCVAGLELVEDGVNGCIVPVGNDKALQNAINKVFENNTDGHMNAASIERIKLYTMENMAKIHMKIFTENLKNGQNYH